MILCKNTHTLVEYDCSESAEDLSEICRRALDAIPRSSRGSRQYVYLGHTFNYLTSGEMVFLCIADPSCSVELPVQFLKDLRHRWERSHKSSSAAADLTILLRDLLQEFNERHGATKIKKMEQELAEVTEVMKVNIDCVLQRGEKMNSLVDKTSGLRSDGMAFRKMAHDAKNKQWWEGAQGRR